MTYTALLHEFDALAHKSRTLTAHEHSLQLYGIVDRALRTSPPDLLRRQLIRLFRAVIGQRCEPIRVEMDRTRRLLAFYVSKNKKAPLSPGPSKINRSNEVHRYVRPTPS